MGEFKKEDFQKALDAIDSGMLDIVDLQPYIEAIKYALHEMAIGCSGCKYEETGTNSSYPCSHCRRCYKDQWRHK